VAIIPLDPGNLDTFEIVGRPLQKFSSGSHHLPTGSISLVNNKSKSIKDIEVRSEFGSGPVVDNSYRSYAESTNLNDYAEFTLTFRSGSFSQVSDAPTFLKLVTKASTTVGAPNRAHKFYLIASSDQTHEVSNYNSDIDISDLVSLTPASFDSSNGLYRLAKRVQVAINKPLKTHDKKDSSRFVNIQHFLASEPRAVNTSFVVSVQYLKTPYYDGGTSGFTAANQIYSRHSGQTNIIVGGRSSLGAGSRDLTTKLEDLLEKTREQPVTANQGKSLKVTRFEPSLRFTKDTVRKNVVKDVLYPSYRHLYPNLHWSYTNYHCLNFFTGSGIPDDSALLYLNKLKPKYSVEIPVLKNGVVDSSEFSKNTASNFVNPAAGFSVDGVTNADKVFVLDSSAADGANYGRHISLTRKITSGTLCTVRFNALKALGAASSAVATIGLKTTNSILSLHGTRITIIDNEGSARTRHYVLDFFNNYSTQANEAAVNISSAANHEAVLTALRTSIHADSGHGRSSDPKVICGTPTASSMTLTQKTVGVAGNKPITVTRDENQNTIISGFANGTASDLVETASSAVLNEPQSGVAATATVRIDDTGANVANTLLTLISTDLTSKVYKFDQSTATSGHINASGQVVVGCSGANANSVAANLQAAILSGQGHNGKLKASTSTNTVTITQTKKGLAGNTSLTKSGDNAGNITIPGAFANGFTGEDIVILHRPASAGTWSELYRLDSATEKTVSQNEWTKVEFDISGDNIAEDYYVKIAQSAPSHNANDHHILHDINFTLEALPEGADIKLPYAYSPREDFTMSFWVKPKIVDKDKHGGYKAGTVMHLTSSYAISIVSGSGVDGLGRSNKFRVMCQFDSSTDIAPSNIPLVKPTRTGTGDGGNTPPTPARNFWENNAQRPDPDPWVAGSYFKNGEYPKDGRIITNTQLWENDADLIFLSSDNALSGDTWHHVAVRWSANKNHRTGSIFIDGVLDSSFNINSGSAMPRSMPDSRGDPSVLFIGNYFDGKNDGNEGVLQSQFFNGNASHQEGVPCAYKSLSASDTTAKLSVTFANTNINGALLTLETSDSVIKTYKFDTSQTRSGQLVLGHIIVGCSGVSTTTDVATRFKTALGAQSFVVSQTGANLILAQALSGPNGNTAVVKAADSNSSIVVSTLFAGGFSSIPNYQIDNFLYRDPADSLYSLDHPLKAEVHEVRIFKSYRSHSVIKRDMTTQFKLPAQDLIFYLPVHFTPEAPVRDIMQTPFQAFRTSTNDPFNVALSFGVGGKTMNLPNFLREHVQKNYPRLLNLTASVIKSTDTQARTADEWLGSVGAHRKGNYTILPCDNGLFHPTYDPILTGSQTKKAVTGSINYVYRDDNGYLRPGLISLRSMVSTASLPMNPGHLLQNPSPVITSSVYITYDPVTKEEVSRRIAQPSDSEILSAKSTREKFLFGQLEGAIPEDPGLAPGSILSVLNRTRDPDSNEVVFFDVSNMFYGNRLSPETISIKDPGLSGTYGSVSITLKDDGYGNIYRHDCLSTPAKWNNVGDVVYDEGIISIKNPILSHFGRKYFEIEFRGEQKVPVLEVTVPCGRNTMNSSSNPNYQPLKPSSEANEHATDFVYISGVNLHDENFNIIGKATFAQPIVKRATDTFMVKLKMDF
jgi:hypothetical protein